MKRKALLILGVVIVSVVIVSIVTMLIVEGRSNPLLKQVTASLGDKRLTLLSPLQYWIDVLGEPLTIQQKDGGHTFFYWPNHGIAVFTHPLYEGQYERKKRNEWLVTSIIVPLKKQVNPYVPPVSKDITINFNSLLKLSINGKYLNQMNVGEIENLFKFRHLLGQDAIEVSNLPIITCSYSVLYLNKGDVDVIELTDMYWFATYD